MDAVKLRAWWWRRQGLDGSLQGAPATKILEQSGWARSVGGSGPYLTLFSRGGLGRDAIDQATADLEIHELPSARGCTYVVPKSDFAIALTVGQGFSDLSSLKTAYKLGVDEQEIVQLSAAILAALRSGPLSPEQLRDATGGASRSLGEEGKKKGLTSTLPVALGLLQSSGEIRRVPVNGRLDQQRYRYTLWNPSPLGNRKPSKEQAYTDLARHFFKWTGPATLGEFRWFSALGAKAAQAAIEPLGLRRLDGERWILAEDLEEFEAFRVPPQASYSLISSLDALFMLRRDLKSLMEETDRKRIVPLEKGCAELGGLTDLSCNAIIDRGRLVGLWEYDPESESIAWISFVPPEPALSEAVAKTEAFVRSDLGDVRSFSLDSPKSRRPRIESLRAAS